MEKEKIWKVFAIFKRVVCSWSFITTEKRKQSPFFFALKVAKRKQTSLLLLTWSKQNARKVYTWLPLYFCLFSIFPFSSDRKFSNKFLFSCVKTFKWYAGDESRDKFKEVEIPFLLNQQKSWRQTLNNKYNKIFLEVNKDCHLNATWVAIQT